VITHFQEKEEDEVITEEEDHVNIEDLETHHKTDKIRDGEDHQQQHLKEESH